MDAFVVDKVLFNCYFYKKTNNMACNCKKNYNALEPFSDEHIDGQGDKKDSILRKFITFLLSIPFGILCAALFIIMAVPFLIFVTICVIFGVQPRINLKLPLKKKKNK